MSVCFMLLINLPVSKRKWNRYRWLTMYYALPRSCWRQRATWLVTCTCYILITVRLKTLWKFKSTNVLSYWFVDISKNLAPEILWRCLFICLTYSLFSLEVLMLVLKSHPPFIFIDTLMVFTVIVLPKSARSELFLLTISYILKFCLDICTLYDKCFS